MKIGVLSDTHDFLDPRVEKIFTGVNHIFHAGDIGNPMLILELQFIAPVTAVQGNCDTSPNYRHTETVELAQKKFLIHHIINPYALTKAAGDAIAREAPHAVVFGHTHRKFAETVNGIFYFNPGYAGKAKFGAERSVAILYLDEKGLRHDFIPL